jgi:hypothetical protein
LLQTYEKVVLLVQPATFDPQKQRWGARQAGRTSLRQGGAGQNANKGYPNLPGGFFPAIAGEMLRQGFTPEEIIKVGGGNYCRIRLGYVLPRLGGTAVTQAGLTQVCVFFPDRRSRQEALRRARGLRVSVAKPGAKLKSQCKDRLLTRATQ